MLTFLISIFGCFRVSLSTTPRVRFLCLLSATVWALVKCSWQNLGLVPSCMCSRGLLYLSYISQMHLWCAGTHLHLHHDYLSETSKCLEPDFLEFSDEWPLLLSPFPSCGENLDGGKTVYWEYGLGTVGLNTGRVIQNRQVWLQGGKVANSQKDQKRTLLLPSTATWILLVFWDLNHIYLPHSN